MCIATGGLWLQSAGAPDLSATNTDNVQCSFANVGGLTELYVTQGTLSLIGTE